MTNQLAIRSHLAQPPHSVICDARAHIHVYEAGGIAFHSQASTQAIVSQVDQLVELSHSTNDLI